MKPIVISLERTPERLEAFHKQNADVVSYTHFVGIDGRQMPRLGLPVNRYIAAPEKHRPGEIGNALSHILLWERFRAGSEFITVCEDDALLHKDFSKHARRCIEMLPTDWDLVFWGWNFDSVLTVDLFPGLCRGAILTSQQDMRRNAVPYLTTDVNASLHKAYNMFGTFCYSVSPKGAAELLNRLCPLRIEKVWIPSIERSVPSRTLDVAMNKHMREMSCYVAIPPLALSMNEHERSTVVGDQK